MKRSIVGFHKDGENDWVAELDCGHNQHARHRPPFINRPWVETEVGRNNHLGVELDCLLCDRRQMPDAFVPYKRTAEFTDSTVPKGLLRSHATKKGVWGKVFVTAGKLRYTAEYPADFTIELENGEFEIIVPELKHSISLYKGSKFYVEFYKKAD